MFVTDSNGVFAVDGKYTGMYIELVVMTLIDEELTITSPMFVTPDTYSTSLESGGSRILL